MRTVLVFPPHAQPFLPHPAVPQLVAVLRREGIDASGVDLSLEAHRHFLSASVLRRLGVDDRTARAAEQARQRIQSQPGAFDAAAYHDGIRDVRTALARVSRAFDGLEWDLKTWRLRDYDPASWADVLRATDDRRANPFVDWFEARVPSLLGARPDLIGISIAWTEQLIPAFTLARILKRHDPGIHLCMGGSLVTHLAGLLEQRPGLFSLVDSLLPFEGDQGLVALARNLGRKRFSDVPGLIYDDLRTIRTNLPVRFGDLSGLPTPEFGDFELTGYLSPRVCLPVSASRGCYWARCRFCSHHLSGAPFRQRAAPDVLAELDILHARHSCQDFYFSDDALPPALAAALADLIATGGRPYRWAAQLRPEPAMDPPWFERLFRGGARLVCLGLESASSRVRGLMDKGADPDTAAKVIAAADAAGIVTWVYFLVGFPGEREAEARETVDFLIARREHIDVIAGGRFVLARHSPLAAASAASGIEVRTDRAKDLAIAHDWVRPSAEAWDERRILEEFRRRPEARKFLEPFVAEPHLLFFPKAHFRAKAALRACTS